MSFTARFAPVRLVAPLAFAALAACTSAPTMGDADPPDAAVTDSSTPDVAPADTAPEGCVDTSGAWESTAACPGTEDRLHFPTQACLTQTACGAITGLGGDSTAIAGNVVTTTYTRGLTGQCRYTFNGDTAMGTCMFTLPVRLTCMRTLRRVTAPGATRYCCDPAGTDCGSGRRCSPVAIGSSTSIVTACLPNGTTAAGATCTETMNRVGTDSCVAGQTCASISPRPTRERSCQKLCSSASNCGANEGCRSIPSVPVSGFCSPHCTMLGTDCNAAHTCRPLIFNGPNAASLPAVELGCEATGTLADGAPCTTNDECGPNLTCALQRGGMTTCRRVCDSTHACPARFSCSPVTDCPFGYNCALFDEGPATSLTNPTQSGACVPIE